MSNEKKTLLAEDVKDKILSAKGQFVKASWKSNPSPAAAYKNSVLLEKRTVSVVQAGVNYANLSSVREGIASGERGEVQELPWGSWKLDGNGVSMFPYVISHKGNDYIRLYPSNGFNHIPKSIFYVNGEEVPKTEFAKYLTPSEAKKLLEPEERPACFTIKAENLLDLPEEIQD